MNKRRIHLMAFVCLAGLLLITCAGCSLLPKEDEVLKPPLVMPQKESYNLYEAKRETIMKQIKGTAVFESSRVVYQEFKGAGQISAIYAKLGDTVKKGDPLIQLNSQGTEITALEKQRDYEKASLALDQAKESRDERLIRIRLLELAIAEQKLNDIHEQLAGIVMTSEMDGVIVSMEQVKLGDTVQTGKSYVTIADPNSVRLSYTSPITSDLQEVQVGMKAEVTYNNQKFTAAVTQSPASAPPTNDRQLSDKYARTIYFKLADFELMPELNATAEVVVVLQKKDNAVVIPRSGLYSIFSRNFVKVLEGESIRELDVEVGIETYTELEIIKGLQEGQQIIIQ